MERMERGLTSRTVTLPPPHAPSEPWQQETSSGLTDIFGAKMLAWIHRTETKCLCVLGPPGVAAVVGVDGCYLNGIGTARAPWGAGK